MAVRTRLYGAFGLPVLSSLFPFCPLQIICDRIFYMATQSSPNLSQRLSCRFRCRFRQLIAGGRGFGAFFFRPNIALFSVIFQKWCQNVHFWTPSQVPSTGSNLEKWGPKKIEKPSFCIRRFKNRDLRQWKDLVSAVQNYTLFQFQIEFYSEMWFERRQISL